MEFDKKNIKIIGGFAIFLITFYLIAENLKGFLASVGGFIGVFTPFIMGAAIAFILNVLMARLEDLLFKKVKNPKLAKAKRPIALLLTLIIVFGGLVVASSIVVPQLAATISSIAELIPSAVSSGQKWIQEQAASSQISVAKDMVDNLSIDWAEMANKLSASLQTTAKNILNSGIGTITNIVNFLVNFVIGLVFSVYVLLKKEVLGRQARQICLAFLGEKNSLKVFEILSLSNRIFSKFISGTCLEAIILGMMFFVTMTIIGLPYAMLISVLIAFTALIPMVGSFIGCAAGVLLILMVNPTQALIFLVLFLVLQQIEGNLIYPFVVGNSVGLPSIWVLVAITIGGNIMGVMGMIIFIPLSSVAYSILRTVVYARLEEKGIAKELWE